jgi:hypothetical protein
MDDIYRSSHPWALQGYGREENQQGRFKYVLGITKRMRAMKQLRTRGWSACLTTIVILVLCLSLSLAGVLGSASSARAADTDTWTRLPLYGGDIGCLVINPRAPSTMYASTRTPTDGRLASVFRSTDSGEHWSHLWGRSSGGLLSCHRPRHALHPVCRHRWCWCLPLQGQWRPLDSGELWHRHWIGLLHCH